MHSRAAMILRLHIYRTASRRIVAVSFHSTKNGILEQAELLDSRAELWQRDGLDSHESR